jgi:hypothetical protein
LLICKFSDFEKIPIIQPNPTSQTNSRKNNDSKGIIIGDNSDYDSDNEDDDEIIAVVVKKINQE